MAESLTTLADGRLRVTEKTRLAVDIVHAYVAMRWWLLRGKLPAALLAARATGPERVQAQPLSPVGALLLGRAVQKTLRVLPFDAKCLIRSLVLIRILARRGVAASLVIGVRGDPSFEAHAWVEVDGVALLPTAPSFRRLAEM